MFIFYLITDIHYLETVALEIKTKIGFFKGFGWKILEKHMAMAWLQAIPTLSW